MHRSELEFIGEVITELQQDKTDGYVYINDNEFNRDVWYRVMAWNEGVTLEAYKSDRDAANIDSSIVLLQENKIRIKLHLAIKFCKHLINRDLKVNL